MKTLCYSSFSFTTSCQENLKHHRCKPNFQCIYCDKTLSTKLPFNRHMKGHTHLAHLATCDICGKVFKSPDYLQKHKQNMHSSDSGLSICKVYFVIICGTT